MAEERAQKRSEARKKKKKRGSVFLGILKVLGTLLVIGCATAALFFTIFMRYVHTTLEPELDVDVSAYTLKQSSVIYYPDRETGTWVELQKIYGSENRTLVNYSDIPDHVVKALVAIEDQRFYEHGGVDWKSTAAAIRSMLLGEKELRGGSTITQQVIKNVTGNNEVTIRRKVLEIFQAMRFAETHSRSEILEIYFNRVYFGSNAYGIAAAAETYFGKDVGDLTVAEGAAIVGITQNPWKYDALRSDWSRAQNRERQETVLWKMWEQGYLTESQYKAALAEKMVFVGDADYVPTEEETEDGSAGQDGAAETADVDSFFVEQVFRDVVAEFEKRGYNTLSAQDKLYTGGLKIYCTLDPKIQEIVEEVYADRSNFNYTSAKGELLQSGMTVIDNSTGNIVAIAGRVGERKGALEWSYATSRSQCGSAIKPLSVYAPALEAGLITPASVIDDYPVSILTEKAWPSNSYDYYRGLITLQDAVRYSANTCAVRVLRKLTLPASYAFMTEKLGFELDNEDMLYEGNLALGGLTKGVSTVEMAAAYETFANNGIYTKPRTFVEVRDHYNNTVIDNQQESWVAMKKTTVYAMNELLKNVLRGDSTGASAAFSGMTIAGKTGTTNARRDRYFVGYSPYYTCAVWSGFPTPERIEGKSNPSAIAWNKVMSRIHEGLENRGFATGPEGMTQVTVCTKTGLRAGAGCPSQTVYIADGLAPTSVCDAHIGVSVCSESARLAGEFCPEELIYTADVLDLEAENTAKGFGYTRELILLPLTNSERATYNARLQAGEIDGIPAGTPVYARDSDSVYSDLLSKGMCEIHTEPIEPTPIDVNDPTTWPEGFDPYDESTWPEGYEPEGRGGGETDPWDPNTDPGIWGEGGEPSELPDPSEESGDGAEAIEDWFARQWQALTGGNENDTDGETAGEP